MVLLRVCKQLYPCSTCRRQSRENPTPHAYLQARSEEILHAYPERSSLRGLTRAFGIFRSTMSNWIKKVAQLPHFLCYHGTDRLGWRRGREKRSGGASVGLGSFDILEGDTPRSLFFYFKECVGVCFTEVSPGHVRLIEVRFVEDCSIQVCSTQISIAEICSLQVCAAEGGTTYICSVEACPQEMSIAQIGTP